MASVEDIRSTITEILDTGRDGVEKMRAMDDRRAAFGAFLTGLIGQLEVLTTDMLASHRNNVEAAHPLGTGHDLTLLVNRLDTDNHNVAAAREAFTEADQAADRDYEHLTEEELTPLLSHLGAATEEARRLRALAMQRVVSEPHSVGEAAAGLMLHGMDHIRQYEQGLSGHASPPPA